MRQMEYRSYASKGDVTQVRSCQKMFREEVYCPDLPRLSGSLGCILSDISAYKYAPGRLDWPTGNSSYGLAATIKDSAFNFIFSFVWHEHSTGIEFRKVIIDNRIELRGFIGQWASNRGGQCFLIRGSIFEHPQEFLLGRHGLLMRSAAAYHQDCL